MYFQYLNSEQSSSIDFVLVPPKATGNAFGSKTLGTLWIMFSPVKCIFCLVRSERMGLIIP